MPTTGFCLMKQLLFILFAFCVISNSYAQMDCESIPSCEELGYTQESCSGGKGVRCPFDESKFYCSGVKQLPDAPEPVVTPEDWTAECADKIDYCTAYNTECQCTACESGYLLSGGVCVVDPCAEKCTTAYPLFAGQDNTKAAVEQIGEKALAAYAASQFYVGDKNGDFGQGKWYLPSIGEWMYAYGTNVAQMKNGDGETGAEGNNNALINDALSTLLDKGIEADVLKSRYYLSSSETGPYNSWIIYGSSGYRAYRGKSTNNYALRCSLLLKDCFNPSAGGTAPIIGDVMYSDKTYGSAADYNGSKIPVGIVSSVSKDGSDVTIINLKDLTFSSYNTVGNFDPNAPYGYDETTTFWCTVDKRTEDISKIQNFDSIQLFTAAQASGNCPCQFYPPE